MLTAGPAGPLSPYDFQTRWRAGAGLPAAGCGLRGAVDRRVLAHGQHLEAPVRIAGDDRAARERAAQRGPPRSEGAASLLLGAVVQLAVVAADEEVEAPGPVALHREPPGRASRHPAAESSPLR